MRKRGERKEEPTTQITQQQATRNPFIIAGRQRCPEPSANRIVNGDCIEVLAGLDSGSVDCVLTIRRTSHTINPATAGL
jgi:hypothetical protein